MFRAVKQCTPTAPSPSLCQTSLTLVLSSFSYAFYSSATTIPATGVWRGGGNSILRDTENCIGQGSEQSDPSWKLALLWKEAGPDVLHNSLPIWLIWSFCNLYCHKAQCCIRTTKLQSTHTAFSDRNRLKKPQASSALMHLLFPKKSICKIFHPFSSCLRSFIFPVH